MKKERERAGEKPIIIGLLYFTNLLFYIILYTKEKLINSIF